RRCPRENGRSPHDERWRRWSAPRRQRASAKLAAPPRGLKLGTCSGGRRAIHIYGLATELNPIKARLSDVIHGAMQAVLGMPADKRAHRFFPMADDDFYSPGGRTRAYTIIEIKMIEGRKAETIKALIQRLFTEIEAQLAIKPMDV